MPDPTPVGPSLQDFVDAVTAEVPNVFGETEADALKMLQDAADTVGSGATVTYSTNPDSSTGEGAVIVTFDGASSAPIDVDIIA